MSAVHLALRKRYPSPAWAYFEEVRNGTGYARKTTRTADALALSLYPSRGLELHGIEVKVSRSDWTRERDDPEKAEEIGRFCERWWLATGPGVVRDVGEIPPAWGWLELDEKGALKTRKDAPSRTAHPLDRLMIAAILRRASEATNARIGETVQALLRDAMAAERELHQEKLTKAHNATLEVRRTEGRLRQLVGEIGRLLGMELISTWGEPGNLSEEHADRLKLLGGRDLDRSRDELKQASRLLRSASARARRALRDARVELGGGK